MSDAANEQLFRSATTAPNPLETPLGKGLLVGGILFFVILFPVLFYLLIWYRHPKERFWIVGNRTDESELSLESGDYEEKRRRSWRAQKRLVKNRTNSRKTGKDPESSPQDNLMPPDTESTAAISPRGREDAVEASTRQPLSKYGDALSYAGDGSNDEMPTLPSAPTYPLNHLSLPTLTSLFTPYNPSSNIESKLASNQPQQATTPAPPPPSPTTPTMERSRINQDPDELHWTSRNPTIPIIIVQHPTPSTTTVSTPRLSVISLDEQDEVNEAVTMSIAPITRPAAAAAAATTTTTSKRRSWGFGALSPKIVEIGRGKVEVLRNVRW